MKLSTPHEPCVAAHMATRIATRMANPGGYPGGYPDGYPDGYRDGYRDGDPDPGGGQDSIATSCKQMDWVCGWSAPAGELAGSGARPPVA
jgi:hypothetical protein